MSADADEPRRPERERRSRLQAIRDWQSAAQAVPRLAASAVRHGLLPVALSTADTVRREGLSDLHWKALGDSLVRFLRAAGPVFTKFGQVLATRNDLLPPAVCARLESLYAQQTPMRRRELRRTLRKAYAKDPPFEEFEDEALAVGSVGQVHRARLPDGTRVIVKIIRPRMEAQIERDLRVARVLLPLALGLSRRGGSASRLLLTRSLDDLAEAYVREVDLLREAASLEEFQRRFEGSSKVKVPKCYHELSSKHVLVMEELVGEPLSAYRQRAKTDPEAARRVANLALTEILKQVFEDGHFHADPHAGNLLILEDGRLGIIDLGLTGELRSEDRRRIASAVKAFLARDAQAVMRSLLGFGTTPPDFDPERFQAELTEVVRRRGRSVADRLSGANDAGSAQATSNPLDEFVGELFAVAHSHGVYVPPSSTLLIKTLVTIEGVGRSLHPELNLATTAAPVILRALAPRWMRWVFQARG